METNLELSCGGGGSPPDKPDDGKYIPLNEAKDRLDAYRKMCSDYFKKKRLNNPKEYHGPSGLDGPFAGNRID